MRFIHAADIHLDSPLINLDRYEGAPVEELRGATRRAMDNLVDLAIQEQVSFVLIAGDLYDGECRDMNTPLELRRSFAALGRAGIRVFIVQGNHDAQSRVTKAFRLEWPDNTHVFSTNAPETVRVDELQVAVHGQGFATQELKDDLSASYPKPVEGFFNIGLLHTNCDAHPGHGDYAKSSISGLRAKRYDYWALGHVHKREVLYQDDPWIVYPGNLQGRHVRETGNKGCTLVTVEGGEVVSAEHRELDVVRWAQMDIDVSECADVGAVTVRVDEALATALAQLDNQMLAARLLLTGESAAHPQLAASRGDWEDQLRRMATDHYDQRVWLEKIRLHTRSPLNLDALEERDDALGELLRQIRDLESADAALADIRTELDAMLTDGPTDPRAEQSTINLDDPARVQAILADAKDLLLSRLLRAEDSK